MSYREVTVIEIKEAVRRYVEAGEAVGLVRNGGEGQLTDELLGVVVAAVRPSRPSGRGVSWQACEVERDRIKGWLEKDLEVTKIHDLLGRRGIEVPYRTLHGSVRRSLAIDVPGRRCRWWMASRARSCISTSAGWG